MDSDTYTHKHTYTYTYTHSGMDSDEAEEWAEQEDRRTREEVCLYTECVLSI